MLMIKAEGLCFHSRKKEKTNRKLADWSFFPIGGNTIVSGSKTNLLAYSTSTKNHIIFIKTVRHTTTWNVFVNSRSNFMRVT